MRKKSTLAIIQECFLLTISKISYLKFFLSHHLKYILRSISAQSQLSVPPAPECISKMAFFLSFFPDSFVSNSNKLIFLIVPFISFISSFINSSSLLLTTSIYDSNVCFKDSIFDIIFLSLPISLDKSIVSLAFHKLLSYKL